MCHYSRLTFERNSQCTRLILLLHGTDFPITMILYHADFALSIVSQSDYAIIIVYQADFAISMVSQTDFAIIIVSNLFFI